MARDASARDISTKPNPRDCPVNLSVMIRADGSIDGGYDKRREGVVLVDDKRTPVRR